MTDTRRKTPEELLRECQAEEREASKKGYLKIFLGYASGVGKSFRMLDEARRRRERGQDVVVGAVQPQVPPEVERCPAETGGDPAQADGRRRRDRRRCHPEAAPRGLLHRRPGLRQSAGLAEPDALAGCSGSADAGIKVVASINIQYVAELREQVEAITGKHVSETVPVSFIKSADEIEIVDAPPEEPIERTPEEQVDAKRRAAAAFQACGNWRWCSPRTSWTINLQDYLEQHGITQHFGAHERILVCITPRANVQDMIETAQIIAERFHGELIVAYVNQPKSRQHDQAALEERLTVARAAGARIEILEGDDPVSAILDFAQVAGASRSCSSGTASVPDLAPRLWGNPVDKLIQRSRGMDVRVFPQ